MTMTAVLTQSAPAMMGQACTFVVAVKNSGASQVELLSMAPVVTSAALAPGGSLINTQALPVAWQPSTACTIGPIVAPIGLGNAQVGGSQFNVPVGAGATVYFSFQVSFFGPGIQGSPAQPKAGFLITVECSADDGTSFIAPPLDVQLNMPQLGQQMAPQSQLIPPVGSLQFSTKANSALML